MRPKKICLTGIVALLFHFGSPRGLSARQQSNGQNGWSITVRGDVKIDGGPTAPEDTVFTGQTVQTGPAGGALVSVPGRGSLFLAPNTSVRIDDSSDHFATLFVGRAGVNSFIGGAGLAINACSYTVKPHPETPSTVQIERDSTDLVSIASLVGRVDILTKTGIYITSLEAGTESTMSPDNPPKVNRSAPAGRNRFLYIGLGAGAAVAGVVIWRAQVSPTSP
jgi:hypothetical protein